MQKKKNDEKITSSARLSAFAKCYCREKREERKKKPAQPSNAVREKSNPDATAHVA
jgi:hypothetical protein